jgi:hypothetical protein
MPKDWKLYGLVIVVGFVGGYLLAKTAKAGLVYVSQGMPIGESIGTDPTLNFVAGPLS